MTNPFSQPVEPKMEWCNICKDNHLQYEDGDLMDCYIYWRNNKEPKERKMEREKKIEIWDMKTKTWVKKTEFYK